MTNGSILDKCVQGNNKDWWRHGTSMTSWNVVDVVGNEDDNMRWDISSKGPWPRVEVSRVEWLYLEYRQVG